MSERVLSITPDDASGGLPRNFPRPCLLLLIGEEPSHGYDLLERMGQLGVYGVDPGGLYRALRQLERDGLVRSRWETSVNGPPRRVYALNGAGWEMLRTWAITLTETHAVVSTYLDRYGELARSVPDMTADAAVEASGQRANGPAAGMPRPTVTGVISRLDGVRVSRP